jgi:hypothetical protein
MAGTAAWFVPSIPPILPSIAAPGRRGSFAPNLMLSHLVHRRRAIK